MKLIWFILFLQFNPYFYDPLLQAIYQTPPMPREIQSEYRDSTEQISDYRNDNPEPEHLSWNLGVPDNLPELEVTY
jgi:hypothetical protein